MQKAHKDLLRTLIAKLRRTLLGHYDEDGDLHPGDLDRQLERLGFARNGAITPLDALSDPSPWQIRAYRVAEVKLTPESTHKSPAGKANAAYTALRAEIVERAAFTWINRLLALRAMEARGLIEETLRPNPAYDGIPEALFILRHTEPARAAAADAGWWAVLEDACRAQAAALPGLFDLEDPNAALRPSTAALLECINHFADAYPDPVLPPLSSAAYAGGVRGGSSGEEGESAFRDPDAIGWCYQFYQEEAKNRTYAKLKSGGKVESRSEIAAVTQLFTEPYMVQWLLQNSLGRTYHELYPESALPAQWAYYIQRGPGTRDQGLGTDDTPSQSPITNLQSLTLLDPCMGSGHFLREGFDMLFAMYREQHPAMPAAEIARRVLAHHIFGIDIDPRAAQLAALTLYLRAIEQIAAEITPSPPHLVTLSFNLATTPGPIAPGALDRHLARHPEDQLYAPILRGIFAALENAHLLGSLLRPGEHLDEAIQRFQKQETKGGQLGLLLTADDEQARINQLIQELGRHDPVALKRILLDRVAASFAAEAGDADDVGAMLFGREASEGLRLIQLLERKYAVVATNPPYMGSGNMDSLLKTFIWKHYPAGKSDIYAAFVIRAYELAESYGRVAMVTQQSWLSLRSFSDLRALPQNEIRSSSQKRPFRGMLHETCIEALCHLGPNAFDEIGGAVVQAVLFIFRKELPTSHSEIAAIRAVQRPTPNEKSQLMSMIAQGTCGDETISRVRQEHLLQIQEFPIVYWADSTTLELLSSDETIGQSHSLTSVAAIGVITSNNNRFVRCMWEVKSLDNRWERFAKGGGYSRWDGLRYFVVDWEYTGIRMKTYAEELPYNKSWSRKISNSERYFLPGITYSEVGSGCIGARRIENTIFDGTSVTIFSQSATQQATDSIYASLNSRLHNYLIRFIQHGVHLTGSYVLSLPFKEINGISPLVTFTERAKQILNCSEMLEELFQPEKIDSVNLIGDILRLNCEAHIEREVLRSFAVRNKTCEAIIRSTGTPAGWHPLITNYDHLPALPADLDLPPLPQAVLDFLAGHERIAPNAAELARIKANLQAHYEAGPGARADDLDLEDLDHHSAAGSDDEDEAVSGAYIPIPTETFLEELSVKLQIHPISVYWLLEELRGEGVRCKPEEQRLLEDRLSVLVLRLLGHRWPKQIEAGEAVPTWADADGIIPLSEGAGEETLAARLRSRLRAEEGDLGAQRIEALLLELTGRNLEEWLRRDFFKRHVSQFKKRPIAWHLASSPQAGGRKRSAQPAFECMLYYHKVGRDALARIRTQYIEPLLARERAAIQRARQGSLLGQADDTAAAIATGRIQELEAFAQHLRRVEETGFACKELDDLLAAEPLDRWSGDGFVAPAGPGDLTAHEMAYHVDVNDGVRVNIAPLQAAGLLAAPVLNGKDQRSAIADRARWRADERRWVRLGKLPRCGWMDTTIPESPRWAELAPEREAEWQRLAEKRAKVLAELGESDSTVEPSR
jgi:hypothetical protein